MLLSSVERLQRSLEELLGALINLVRKRKVEMAIAKRRGIYYPRR
jgi:hypothetical protein